VRIGVGWIEVLVGSVYSDDDMIHGLGFLFLFLDKAFERYCKAGEWLFGTS